jgi:hypothetical protein
MACALNVIHIEDPCSNASCYCGADFSGCSRCGSGATVQLPMAKQAHARSVRNRHDLNLIPRSSGYTRTGYRVIGNDKYR